MKKIAVILCVSAGLANVGFADLRPPLTSGRNGAKMCPYPKALQEYIQSHYESEIKNIKWEYIDVEGNQLNVEDPNGNNKVLCTYSYIVNTQPNQNVGVTLAWDYPRNNVSVSGFHPWAWNTGESFSNQWSCKDSIATCFVIVHKHF